MKYLALLLIFLFPFNAFALTGTINPTCADFTLVGGSGSCTGDVWTFSNTSAEFRMYTDLPSPSQIVYLTYTVSSSNNFRWTFTDSMTPVVLSGDQENTPITAYSGTNDFYDMYANGVFTGTLSDLCISDAEDGCGSPTPPTPPATTTSQVGYGDWLFVVMFFGFWVVYIALKPK